MPDVVTRRARSMETSKQAGAKQSSSFKTIKGAKLSPGETIYTPGKTIK